MRRNYRVLLQSPRFIVMALFVYGIAGGLVVPLLIRYLYSHNPLPGITDRVMTSRGSHNLDYFLGCWDQFFWPFGLALVFLAVLFYCLQRSEFVKRNVLGADARDLAGIRIVIFGSLLISAIWEDVASVSLLPGSMHTTIGRLDFLTQYAWMHDASTLGALRWVTIVFLIFAVLGFMRWISLPLGWLGYLLIGYIQRQFATNHATGILPLYVGFVLIFMPCTDAWSLRFKKKNTPEKASSIYGWSRYVCWAVVAVCYMEAGLSKLRVGGLRWWDPLNLKYDILHDSLNPMHFDFGVGLWVAQGPNFIFALLGISALVIEIGYIFVLFSKRARNLFPLLALGLHSGILLLQNILFFDLMLMPMIFFPWSRDKRESSQKTNEGTGLAPVPFFPIVGVLSVVGVLMWCWARQVEDYPLTAMQMYADRKTDSHLKYVKAFAHHASGKTERAPIEWCIPALRDARYRRTISYAFVDDKRAICDELMKAVSAACKPRYQQDPIVSFELQRWVWDFEKDASSPTRGAMTNRYTFDVATQLSSTVEITHSEGVSTTIHKD